MRLEVEQKHRVDDVAALIARLEARGVTIGPPVRQVDQYFAHPARTLLNEVRWRFPLHAQRRVFAVIERHLTATRQELERSVGATLELTGKPLRCRATTRRSVPCNHEPDPRTGYCSWHRHLADDHAVVAA